MNPLGFALLLACAAPVRAVEPPPSHVVVAGAASDTLAWNLGQVLPVAIDELRKNDWTIQRADSTEGTHRIVTRWKPLKHVLARTLLEGVMARCVVDLEPVSGNRTLVRIQGGLAGKTDLEGSPAFPVAQTTYRAAAERWLNRVEGTLEASRR